MKKRITILVLLIGMTILAGCMHSMGNAVKKPTAVQSRTVVDMAGREVQIPDTIEQVYATGQPGVVLLYTLTPDRLMSWCLAPSEQEMAYIEPKYRGLPVLGLLQGANSNANREEILARAPDLILMATLPDADGIANADALQQSMGLPVVLVDYRLEQTAAAYRFLGDLLNCASRAEALAAYCDKTLDECRAAAAAVPEDKRLQIYYAQGSSGLQTAPKGSSHSEVIDLAGGENVVRLEAGSDGRLTVNMEQILQWNPQVVIVSYSMEHAGGKGDSAVYQKLRDARESWGLVQAVQDKKVYQTPCLPYNWLDMPPSANRIIGVAWMCNLLYPEAYPIDIRRKTAEFYQLFYHKDLSDAELSELLDGAVA